MDRDERDRERERGREREKEKKRRRPGRREGRIRKRGGKLDLKIACKLIWLWGLSKKRLFPFIFSITASGDITWTLTS